MNALKYVVSAFRRGLELGHGVRGGLYTYSVSNLGSQGLLSTQWVPYKVEGLPLLMGMFKEEGGPKRADSCPAL